MNFEDIERQYETPQACHKSECKCCAFYKNQSPKVYIDKRPDGLFITSPDRKVDVQFSETKEYSPPEGISVSTIFVDEPKPKNLERLLRSNEITVIPDDWEIPITFSGNGGEFAGGGASADWDDSHDSSEPSE